MSTPTRRRFPLCCARAITGPKAAQHPVTAMKSRRRIAPPRKRVSPYQPSILSARGEVSPNHRLVLFGSKTGKQQRSLFNYFVRASEPSWRDRKTQSLGGPTIDDQLEFSRGLHRQIAW